MTRDLNRVARDTNTLNGQVNTLLAALIQQKLESVSDGNAANGGTAAISTQRQLMRLWKH